MHHLLIILSQYGNYEILHRLTGKTQFIKWKKGYLLKSMKPQRTDDAVSMVSTHLHLWFQRYKYELLIN